MVLTMFTIVISISVVIVYRNSVALEERLFFSQLHQDILVAQSLAVSNQKITTLKFLHSQRVYIISSQINEIKRVPFPPTVAFYLGSNLKEVQFSTSGNAVQFGTMLFTTSQEMKRITVHIGKGRVDYER